MQMPSILISAFMLLISVSVAGQEKFHIQFNGESGFEMIETDSAYKVFISDGIIAFRDSSEDLKGESASVLVIYTFDKKGVAINKQSFPIRFDQKAFGTFTWYPGFTNPRSALIEDDSILLTTYPGYNKFDPVIVTISESGYVSYHHLSLEYPNVIRRLSKLVRLPDGKLAICGEYTSITFPGRHVFIQILKPDWTVARSILVHCESCIFHDDEFQYENGVFLVQRSIPDKKRFISMDTSGNIVWQKDLSPESSAQIIKGTKVVFTWTYSPSDRSLHITFYDSVGKFIRSTRQMPYNLYDILVPGKIVTLVDSSYLRVQMTNRTDPPGVAFMIIKFDKDNNYQWERYYYPDLQDVADFALLGAYPTSDGGFILSSGATKLHSDSKIPYKSQFVFLVKFDASGCTDEPDCLVSIRKRDIEDLIKIFPNPSVDKWVNIELNQNMGSVRIHVYNSIGQIVDEVTVLDRCRLIMPEQGMYFIEAVTDEGYRFVRKFLAN